MAGMWVAHIEVKDPDKYAEYLEGSTEVAAKYGGTFVARAGRYQQKEGRDYPRNVLIRYPTYERAVEAYESPEYQAIVQIAKDASERHLSIIEIDD